MSIECFLILHPRLNGPAGLSDDVFPSHGTGRFGDTVTKNADLLIIDFTKVKQL